MDQSKIQRRKAASMMEKGLTSTTPQVKVKKSSEMRMRNEIAKERPIGLKKGGAVHSEKGEKMSDKKQDKALMSRHNRLMHPGQTSKLAKGGKPMAAGGVAKIRHGAATPSGMPKAQPRHKKNPALI